MTEIGRQTENVEISAALRLAASPLSPAPDYDTARQYYDAAVVLAQAGKFDEAVKVLVEGTGLTNTGVSVTRRIPGTAELEYRALAALLEQPGAFDGERLKVKPHVLNQLGFQARSLGDMERSMQYLEQAGDAWVELGQLDLAAAAKRAIAHSYVNLGELDRALQFAEQGVALVDEAVEAEKPYDKFMLFGSRATAAHVLHMQALGASEPADRLALLQRAGGLFLDGEHCEGLEASEDYLKAGRRMYGLPNSQYILLLLDTADTAADRSVVLEQARQRAEAGAEMEKASAFNRHLDTALLGLCRMAQGDLTEGQQLVNAGAQGVTECGRADVAKLFAFERRADEYRQRWEQV